MSPVPGFGNPGTAAGPGGGGGGTPGTGPRVIPPAPGGAGAPGFAPVPGGPAPGGPAPGGAGAPGFAPAPGGGPDANGADPNGIPATTTPIVVLPYRPRPSSVPAAAVGAGLGVVGAMIANARTPMGMMLAVALGSGVAVHLYERKYKELKS